MKNIKLSILVCFMANFLSAKNIGTLETDSTGFPGDSFSLQGALELFKNSSSPEDFEKKLNLESSNVNNLDLNSDNEIDYLSVIDKMEGSAHALIIRAIVSETESQDVAVIGIEKDGNESAVLQIVGVEELYGKDVIAEPFNESETIKAKPGEKGPSISEVITRKVVVNVWFWPSVRFMYAPAYVVWVSPWGWRNHPAFFKPWRPRPYRVFHAGWAPYRAHHRIVTVHRVGRAHKIYAPHRRTAVVVKNRHRGTHVGPRNGQGVRKTNAVRPQKANNRKPAAKKAAGNTKGKRGK